MTRKKTILSALCLIVLFIGAYFYFSNNKKVSSNSLANSSLNQKTERQPCLSDDEYADYPVKENSFIKLPKENPVVISVRDKKTEKEKFKFGIDNTDLYHYHPIELHKCGVYVVEKINYDIKKSKQDAGFKAELKKYNYLGQFKKNILLSEVDKNGNFQGKFSYDFRINPTEKYVVLEKGYSGRDDYSVVIKNLETKEDSFVLPMKNILEKYPDLLGVFGMNEWSSDGKYYWGNIFDGANVLAFLRIEKETWKTDILPAPAGTMGGDLLNSNNGYVTYDDGAPWTGDEDFNQMYRDQWKKENKKVHFYLYNLFSGEKIFLGEDSDPNSDIETHWLSDKEFQYTLPSGESKIITIP